MIEGVNYDQSEVLSEVLVVGFLGHFCGGKLCFGKWVIWWRK